MKIALWIIVALLAVLLVGQMVFVWADDDSPGATNNYDPYKP